MDYVVKVKVTATSLSDPNVRYKPAYMTGEFVSKGKKTLHSKIEAQVKEGLLKFLKEGETEADYTIKVLKIERCDKKFIIVEDKV